MSAPLQRGNPNIMKSIQQRAKQISQSNGLSAGIVPTSVRESPMYEAGAFASMQKRNNAVVSNTYNAPTNSRGSVNLYEKKLMDRLMESVETLGSTGEYFNATSSLLTLYAMGALTESVMSSLSKTDLREIRGIVREFKSILDSY